MLSIFNYIKLLLILLILFGFISIFTIFYALWTYSSELPSYESILNYKPNLSSRVYSSDGFLLKSFYTEERIFIPVNRIPKKIKYAFLASEDKNFYNHYGIDIIAIIRAFLTNILNINSNKRVVGASTITQQVVKNLLLTNELSYSRKIKEIILAIRIENILDKDEILELYLNDIYLGYGSYGIGSASLNYFNKSIYDLELHEIAFLAALPKAPNNYNPKNNYLKAIDRRNWVIDRMYTNGYIKLENLEYKNKPLKVFNRSDVTFSEADYFYEEIRKELFNKFGKNKLYSEGLIIKTALDSKIQKSANLSLIEGLVEYEKKQGWNGPIENTTLENFLSKKKFYDENNPFFSKWEVVIVNKVYQENIEVINHKGTNITVNLENVLNKWLSKKNFKEGDVIYIEKNENNYVINQEPNVNGAIIVLDPHTGDILALSGGYSFRKSEFNRATQAKRQPGSAFKPIVYAAALENGYLPNSLILDAPFVSEQGAGLKDWKPENYGKKFYGPSTLRKGIEKSRNLMTVRIAQNLGFEKIALMSKNLGVYENIPELLSVSLGSNETTLLKLTTAYCSFVNGGKKINSKMIKRIQDRRGKTIYNSEGRSCSGCEIFQEKNKSLLKILDNRPQVISPETAYQVTSLLEGAVKRGTGKKLRVLEVPLAGKTGTTNDNYDAWFIGFTSNLVIGVYIGYDDPKSLGKYETGSKVALPVFKKFVETALYKEDFKPFKVPSGIYFYPVNYDTGEISNFDNRKSILESFKENSSKTIKLKNLNFGQNYGKSLKFKGFY